MLQGQMVVTRCVTQIDKRTALPLRIPKNGGGCTKRRPILDVHDVKQQKVRSKGRKVPSTRAQSRRAHARVVSVLDARAAANADARSRVISGMWLSVSLWAHRVPPAWWRRVVARRRLVRLFRSLSGRFVQCREARGERAGGAPRARSL